MAVEKVSNTLGCNNLLFLIVLFLETKDTILFLKTAHESNPKCQNSGNIGLCEGFANGFWIEGWRKRLRNWRSRPMKILQGLSGARLIGHHTCRINDSEDFFSPSFTCLHSDFFASKHESQSLRAVFFLIDRKWVTSGEVMTCTMWPGHWGSWFLLNSF